ncbi:MAG: hypothetical protein HY585_03695 [Candidatus Omnitrophica bacterium]|nr:hypothetical protein [Candidatus Omnitrophota bacterium]
MKKAFALMLVMLIACAPLSFAACSICNATASDSYAKAAGAKLIRGVSNIGLSWVELFRQPTINENKWEGVGRGLVHTVGRIGVGALDVVTFLFPRIETPTMSPSCPLDLMTDKDTTTA